MSKHVFPQEEKWTQSGYERIHGSEQGITLLEHYAGMAMQGVIARSQCSPDSPEAMAKKSIRHAKALIKELDNDKNSDS
jgi:hypothetical protein